MEHSKNFGFALPSSNNDVDLADINEIANNFRKIDENAVKKEDGKGLSTNDFTDEYKKKLDGASPLNVQSDMNENDENNPAYIKNRTHYKEDVEVDYITIPYATPGESGFTLLGRKIGLVVGTEYSIDFYTVDGEIKNASVMAVPYVEEDVEISGVVTLDFGDAFFPPLILDGAGFDADGNVFLDDNCIYNLVPYETETTEDLSKIKLVIHGINSVETVYHKIPNEYIDFESLGTTELTSAINTALEQAKASGEFDGADGKDGVNGADGKDGTNGTDGISATHSWNGTVLTVTSASGTSSADLKGDKGDKGDTGTSGSNGKDGTSVTVKSVSGSTADGGNNVVTFSDGKTLTVKNGSKGSKGDKGDTGSQGIQGEKGEQGIQGVKGDKGDKGDKGADGKTPVKGTDYFTEADKKEMVESVVASLDGIPNYWQTALQDGANEIRQAMETAGRKKSAFLFYSDAHWDYGSRMSPKLLKYLYKHTSVNKTFFGGDIVNSESTDRDVMEYLYEWREMLRDLPNHHSVVGNHDDGNATNNLFSTNYVYSYLLAAEETPQVVQGGDMYYYIDEPCEKTRYLFLDTAYKGLDDEQKAFITDTLKSTPSGWHIVVVAHIWYMPDYDQYNVRPIPLTGLSTDATTVTAILDNYNSRTDEFADCGGWVEFCIGGHVHRDYDGKTTTGIPIILVETDSKHIRSQYTYTAGTTTEASVNGIIADYENHKIYVVRIGRGESREITVTNYVVSYTNLLQTAEVGYEKDQEYSTSSFNQRPSSGGFDLTGFIPLTDGDTFYLKNFVMPNGHTTWRNCGVYLFNSDKSWKGNFTMSTSDTTGATFKPIYGDDGNLIQFTVPSGMTGCYMRINCTQIDDTSILTRNEPIE